MHTGLNPWNAFSSLPDGYVPLEKMDLTQKEQAKTVLGLSLGLIIPWLALGIWLSPVLDVRQLVKEGAFLHLLAVLVGVAVYIPGHEAVHGALMWHFSRVRPRFGLKLMYAYAGSDVYFAKRAYLCIALAPLLVWGIALTVLSQLAPLTWFWPVWMVQLMNITGAAGDLYVSWKIGRMPATVLVQDTGVAMTVYDLENRAG